MPVTVKVNGAANSLVHKGSNGISTATIPDVCKTPTPGGPVPMPYPNISQSAMLAKGTTTVKADGMMIAVKGSEFSISNGDQPGTAGGVKSNVFMKESTWLLYSFDVKMDGKNACRLTDKMFHNHENTVNMGGVLQPPVVVVEDIKDALCAEFCKELKKGGTRSYDLEQRLRRSRKFKNLGVKFAPDTSVSHVFQGLARTTIPDAALFVAGKIVKCFDFKFPGDRWRGDQYERQTRLAKRVPEEISKGECGC
jgi:uncharacterized Zn-binding protein involved in type VI secretion